MKRIPDFFEHRLVELLQHGLIAECSHRRGLTGIAAESGGPCAVRRSTNRQQVESVTVHRTHGPRKWRWSSVAIRVVFRRSATAITDASAAPSGKSAYLRTSSAMRAKSDASTASSSNSPLARESRNSASVSEPSPAFRHIADLGENRTRNYQAPRIGGEQVAARGMMVIRRIQQSDKCAGIADDHSSGCPSSRRRPPETAKPSHGPRVRHQRQIACGPREHRAMGSTPPESACSRPAEWTHLSPEAFRGEARTAPQSAQLEAGPRACEPQPNVEQHP